MRRTDITREAMNRERVLPGLRAAMLSLLLCVAVLPALGQLDTLGKDSDELFATAREMAFSGKRDEARALCEVILRRSPGYVDARVLIGRTLVWDGRRAEGREALRKAVGEKPRYRDAMNALIDVDLLDDSLNEALATANQGLRDYPTDEDLLLRKARALKYLNRYDEALRVLTTLEEIDPAHPDLPGVLASIRLQAYQYEAGVSYEADRFSDIYDPMHYSAIQLKRRTPWGSLFFRLNFARKFGENGFQPEVDFYPSIMSGVYAYLNYGYSAQSIYPTHRFGAELTSKLPASLEASAGLRYLYFGPGSSVAIFTGSVGMYEGSYWFSLRPYITPGDAGISRSLSLTVRRYFSGAEDYYYLRLGGGFSPDERITQLTPNQQGKEIVTLGSQSMSLGWQENFGGIYLLLVDVNATRQELSFDPGHFVWITSLSIGARYRF